MPLAPMPIPLGIWLVRAEDEHLAQVLYAKLGGEIYRPWLEIETSQKTMFAAYYRQHTQWIVIAATGIAVRFLDGQIKSKQHDPAVVVIDTAGRYAIALLGGHEGGANALAYRVANCVGAVPVVTTATEALKPLVIGIGCRKGVMAAQIELAINQALGQRVIGEVREIATIDLKANEPGLVEFCQQQDIPLRIFASAAIEQRPWVMQASEWVQQNIGLPGVCEPCALLASVRGKLIVPKFCLDGVAVAVVEDNNGVNV